MWWICTSGTFGTGRDQQVDKCYLPHETEETCRLREHIEIYLPNQALRPPAAGIRGGRRRVTAPVPRLVAAVGPVQGGAFVRRGQSLPIPLPFPLLRAGRALLLLEPLLVGDALDQLREVPAAPADIDRETSNSCCCCWGSCCCRFGCSSQ